ncbi:MAG: TetR family transcriptional regulator [Salinisphaeraceae bacterium]|nr:TetR family transcriptional regulator [Salinisphaeraceae bacterium]
MSSRSASPSRPKWGDAVQGPDERHALKRRALLQEAGRAFSRGGFANTSLDDVAAMLGVSKPALYYYFKSKHEILYECHKTALDLGDQARDEAEVSGGNGLQRLHAFILRYVELLTGELGVCAVLTEHYALRKPDRERIQARRRGFDQYLQTLIRDGMADGSIAECNPRLAVTLIMGAVNSIHAWYMPEGDLSGREIAEELMLYVSDGLAGTTAQTVGRRPDAGETA